MHSFIDCARLLNCDSVASIIIFIYFCHVMSGGAEERYMFDGFPEQYIGIRHDVMTGQKLKY